MKHGKSPHKVFIGLSGGVDSAVSAALLLRAGYDVTGVFIKIWQPEFVECTWKEDRLDAMRVAAHLRIPFETVDLSLVYKDEVISRMITDYTAGITPNPDVLCNRFVKFGAFADWAFAHGADFIATGHHAQIKKEGDIFHLVRGVDSGKDQAYFLSLLTQKDLSRALFPIGHLTKKEVRAKAHEFGLPVADRPDSQGLCFVGAVDMHSFLRELIHPKPGIVRATDGTPIGRHDGAALYTLGQRHAFVVTNPLYAKTPQYVTHINSANNEITVGPLIVSALRTLVPISFPSWTESPPKEGVEYEAEMRYHQRPVLCTVIEKNGTYEVVTKTPVLAVPGQALVLYEKTVCLGGGTIRV